MILSGWKISAIRSERARICMFVIKFPRFRIKLSIKSFFHLITASMGKLLAISKKSRLDIYFSLVYVLEPKTSIFYFL